MSPGLNSFPSSITSPSYLAIFDTLTLGSFTTISTCLSATTLLIITGNVSVSGISGIVNVYVITTSPFAGIVTLATSSLNRLSPTIVGVDTCSNVIKLYVSINLSYTT